jgi:hypothetical protein
VCRARLGLLIGRASCSSRFGAIDHPLSLELQTQERLSTVPFASPLPPSSLAGNVTTPFLLSRDNRPPTPRSGAARMWDVRGCSRARRQREPRQDVPLHALGLAAAGKKVIVARPLGGGKWPDGVCPPRAKARRGVQASRQAGPGSGPKVGRELRFVL